MPYTHDTAVERASSVRCGQSPFTIYIHNVVFIIERDSSGLDWINNADVELELATIAS
jgi:hypothetical protein